MTSTSSEPADLRSGRWTRLGHRSVLGDAVTEAALEQLTDRSLRAATAQGFAQGWAEGRAAALAEGRAATARVAAEAETARDEAAARARTEQEQALAALAAGVQRLEQERRQLLDVLADRAVEVALAVAETVVGRELAVAADPGADAVRRALAAAPAAGPATVRLNPEDHALLDPTLLDGTDLTVVADPALGRGDAVLETADTVVDATVDAALDRVREVLRP